MQGRSSHARSDLWQFWVKMGNTGAKSLYLPIVARSPETPLANGFLLAPCIAGFVPSHRDIASLLPIADVNAAILDELKSRTVAEGGIAGFLLADPFLRPRDAQLALNDAGVRRIANYPTVQLIDGETARAFESAKAGAAREIEMLGSFRSAGFETVAFATDLPTAQSALEHGASVLVLHPGLALSDWRERANAGLHLVRMLKALRPKADVPVLVYRPHGFGHELDHAVELADGVAQIEA